MNRKQLSVMDADDARQYMLKDNFEIYEKKGIPSGAMEMHFHHFYEIMFICQGDFAILVNNITYHLNPGDFILIRQNQFHHYQYVKNQHENSKRILMWVSANYLETLAQQNADLTSCFTQTQTPAWHFPAHHREHLSQYLNTLLYLESDSLTPKGEKQLLEDSYLTLFFISLNQLCRHPEFSFRIENTSSNPMIRTLTDYINEHIDEPITLDTLASQAHLSKYHFVRVFKELTGMTVHDFVNHKRILKACELIWEGEAFSNISELCGFSDYSSFFRNFKAVYGISPREFKAMYRGNFLP
ncbi:helix-turn-helix domain-containing protein [Blautia liquoris]|uniref:Helix-turn-helix domain-containing protein n=1 Tax=Blautia liquoris TaxID=2779518 RepID=A0A7M2RI69_9FIRM|nr:AraC family transcriptional regulator [Blautia liquoris]QOV20033.1 helix-turn-helix domain-containing protein [Blautia liquoris]